MKKTFLKKMFFFKISKLEKNLKYFKNRAKCGSENANSKTLANLQKNVAYYHQNRIKTQRDT